MDSADYHWPSFLEVDVVDGAYGLGTPCSFDPSTDTDPCVAGGYMCSADETGGSGSCVLPGNEFSCFDAIGCQDGGSPALVCAEELCTVTCTATSDCSDPGFSCQDLLPQSSACYYNLCGPGWGSAYFGACDAAGVGDGQCLPDGTGSDEYGECFQAGSAAAGEPCSFRRGGPNPQCGQGLFCIESQTNPGPYRNGICMPITVDGGCGSSADDAWAYAGTDWGICVQACTPNEPCPSGMTCGDSLTSFYGCLPQ